MSMDDKPEISIPVRLSIENDLEVDSKGIFHLITLISNDNNNSDDEYSEYRQPFDEVINGLIEFYQGDSSALGAGQLYMIANELSRHVDRLRAVAVHLEGRLEPNDIIEIEDEDTPQGYPV